MSKSDSGGTTSYKRAGAYVTDSLLKSTVSSTTTDYTPGVSSRVGSDSTFLHSGIKNADTQTDDGGDVSAMRRYDAFGNPLAAWGGWQGPFGYGGPYGYQTDPDHGLMLLGHRYYESDTGRFLTRDPIKDGRNWYEYCGGNPANGEDSSGLVWIRLIRRGLEQGRRFGGNISKGGAIDARKRGDSVVVIGKGARRTAKEIEDTVPGKTIHHGKDDHAQPTYRNLDHYQTNGQTGHTFYIDFEREMLSLVPILGELIDLVDAFSEYLDEITPGMKRGATHMRVNRWLGGRDEYTDFL